jgi:endo-1,4-beta-D-glucanase Y/4-amino-4-deoxy-L-arabinose transferase-like glycosyltransferase
MIEKIKQHKLEILLIGIILIISAFAHGYNMFNYPYYESDEGTYMSQAWSVSEQGNLAPYTYWYDHAPAGWLFIAGWAKVTGGYFAFGDALASGRIFMLVLHVCIAGLLYFITRKLSNGILAPTIAVLLFSLSPLGIYFQRRILLDNIMLFWSMISIAILLKDNLKIRHIVLSGLAFGIAILTKETAIFFIPALLYGVYLYSHVMHRRIALVQWLAVTGSVTSLYFFYALLKGEFFPVKAGEHRVSLLETFAYQSSRGSGYPFWNIQSDFYHAFVTWLSRDPYLIIFGIVSTLILLVFALRDKKLRMPVLLIVFSCLFLMRGGLIIDFYVILLIPFLALAIGVVAQKMMIALARNSKLWRYALSSALVLILVLPSALSSTKQYINNETEPQLKAMDWIRENVDPKKKIVIENWMYTELRNPNKDPIFNDSEWYYKVQLDPSIRSKFQNSWKNIDYIAISYETLQTIQKGEGDFIGSILAKSELVASWGPLSKGTYLNVEQLISTNGDWAQVYKVRDPDEIYIANSWKKYKEDQIISYGQVIDTYSGGHTTSEGQSYALLRSVWMGDKNEFDGVWNWTKDHMQYRPNDKLFSWLWDKDDSGVYRIKDHEAASDADQDIALALLFAYKQWGDPQYLDAAKVIINDIWKHEVVEVKDKNYLVANTIARHGDLYLINPSYLSPATYRIFFETDPAHDWMSVVDSSYQLLNEVSVNPKGELQLPSNWVMLDADTGATSSAVEYTGQTSDQYGYDAFRVMWRIALDEQWNKEPRAEAYLSKYQSFFSDQFKEQKLVSVYTNSGLPVSDVGNISTDVGALSVFKVTDKKLVDQFYQERIASAYNEEGYWEERNNYYGQNWAWFGTALHKDFLKNLWSTPGMGIE